MCVLIPDALIAVISLSDDNLPNAIIVATNVAIGTAKENIHPELNNIYLNIIDTDKPFPINLSICFTKV